MEVLKFFMMESFQMENTVGGRESRAVGSPPIPHLPRKLPFAEDLRMKRP